MDRSYAYNRNFGLLYRAKQLLNNESLKTICLSYIYSCRNYASVALISIYFTKLKRIR